MDCMNARPRRWSHRKMSSWFAILALLAGSQWAVAQSPLVAPFDVTTADANVPRLTLPSIIPATCTNCDIPQPVARAGHGIFLPRHTGGSTAGCTDTLCGSAGCGEGDCVAGRAACTTAEGYGPMGRLASSFHNAFCCPDPCYEGRWSTTANAGLFLDYARPTTLTRFRWDRGIGMTNPDRGEYFWAKTGGKGPPLKLNGQIDRLVETANEIMIIDYKTNRPPPTVVSDVAETYLVQLSAYRVALAAIFPGKTVRAALLWTQTPSLMEIPAATLDAYGSRLWELGRPE